LKISLGLANAHSALGIEFKHHSALEDAKDCGEILVFMRAHLHRAFPQSFF
jgi:hypothetical protein